MFTAAYLPLFFIADFYRRFLSPFFIADISANRGSETSA